MDIFTAEMVLANAAQYPLHRVGEARGVVRLYSITDRLRRECPELTEDQRTNAALLEMANG